MTTKRSPTCEVKGTKTSIMPSTRDDRLAVVLCSAGHSNPFPIWPFGRTQDVRTKSGTQSNSCPILAGPVIALP
jgi:hypothetical protein